MGIINISLKLLCPRNRGIVCHNAGTDLTSGKYWTSPSMYATGGYMQYTFTQLISRRLNLSPDTKWYGPDYVQYVCARWVR